MKVTSDRVIRSGEQELLDAITADLDWEAVEAAFVGRHNLPLGDDVSYKKGDLVVHEDRIAYRLEFEIKVPLSMLLDREGNCITFRAAAPHEEADPEAPLCAEDGSLTAAGPAGGDAGADSRSAGA
jgi:hypothetical protein